MQLEPRITIRDLPRQSAALEAHLREKIKKLEVYNKQIMHCDVVVEQSQKHQHQGKLYNVRINLTVPGKQINVNLSCNEDVYVAIRDAFNAARRQLKTYGKRIRNHVKNHEPRIHGFITRVFPDEGFGIIEANDNEYYFSEMNIATTHELIDLLPGTEVLFIEVMGSEGKQANRVTIGKHQMLEEIA